MASFYDRRTMHPGSLAIVVALHAAALTAVALVKGPQFIRLPPVHTRVTFIPLPEQKKE